MYPPVSRDRGHPFGMALMSRLVVPVLVAFTSLGCSRSSSRPDARPVYPVEGYLFVAGKPAIGALVALHPDGEGPLVTASVHPDGRFVPVQADGAIGLTEGSYALTATWHQENTDRLGNKHSDPSKPLTRFTVQRGFNRIPPIQLP